MSISLLAPDPAGVMQFTTKFVRDAGSKVQVWPLILIVTAAAPFGPKFPPEIAIEVETAEK